MVVGKLYICVNSCEICMCQSKTCNFFGGRIPVLEDRRVMRISICVDTRHVARRYERPGGEAL